MKQFWSDLGGKLGVGLCGAGLLLVFLGWNGAASVDRVEAQFPYLISGGIAGLCLVVIGVGLLIVQNQRADRAELQRTLRELHRVLDPEAAPTSTFEPPIPRPTPDRYRVDDGVAAPEEIDDDDGEDDDDGRAQRRGGRRAPLRAD